MKTGSGTSKKLIVISYDAFSQDNWELASKLPNLSKLIKDGAYSTRLKSVYPTLTYVAHTTMVTGVFPDKHGIFHNNPFQPFVREKDQEWFWFRENLKLPPVYEALNKYHKKAACILWPVTGKAAVKYNIPEIRAIKKENQILKALKNGSPLFSIGMELKFGRIRKGIEQPYLDDFTAMCAADTIRRKKPDLLMVHLIDLDDAKHYNGTVSTEVEQAIHRMDQRIGDLRKAVREAGISENTVFMVVGDHGQLDVRYQVHLNTMLREKGLIYEKDREMKWRAYIQSAGGAAYLHLKPDDPEAEKLALTVLEEAWKKDDYGIEHIYTGQELKDYHVDTKIQYMLEAKEGYCFEDGLNDPVIVDLKERRIRHATHGYSPDKPGYRCNLVISGTGIKAGYEFGDTNMTDIAPTIAKILGIEFGPGDGRPLNEIFIE